MVTPRLAVRLLIAVFALALSFPASVHAEGSAQVGTTQGLQTDTVIYVDIFALTEDITWSFTGGVQIFNPSGTRVVNSFFNSGTWNTVVTGRYQVIPRNAQAGAWDVSVSGTAAGKGRVHSPSWHFSTGTFAQSGASNASYYGLVPGGLPNTSGVVEVKLDGMSGYDYTVGANRTGVAGANAGRSVAISGNTFTPSLEMYLLPPEASTYDPVTPTALTYSFHAGAKSCNLIVPGTTTGTFTFTTNVDGTYNLVCDLDKDTVFNRVSSTDLLIVGTTTAGVNNIAWDGKDNGGVNVPVGTYNCEVFVNTGEMHFVGSDIETSYQGLRLFSVDSTLAHSPLTMFWNDNAVQANDVTMTSPATTGLQTSSALGINAGTYATAAGANVNAHSWGNFNGGGNSKGNDALVDTFGSILSTVSGVAQVRSTTSVADGDADTLTDYVESCTLGTDPTKKDTDGDGYNDNVEAPGGSAVDTDGDGTIDALDTDSDNDGVPDSTDTNRTNPNICRDVDGDGCNDCAVTGANNSGGAVMNDGLDTDSDGACNVGDPDDDNDGVPDATDTAPLNSSSCADADMDGCNDCAIVHTMGGSITNDGLDTDGDGKCNVGDTDDDNDGVLDTSDNAPLNSSSCRDTDTDGCDDCAIVHTGGGSISNDGTDTDGDGKCNVGDPDDDNDGVVDGMDNAPLNSSSCRDADADSCDDCAIVHTGGGSISNDGTDTDGDGKCNVGDTDDDNDGVIDTMDSAPLNSSLCRDLDNDTCNDCAIVHTGGGSTSNDGLDSDTDGKCNAGDTDDDNDGVLDTADSAPLNSSICRDVDNDTCDDCAIVHTGGGSTSNDGADTDADGICNAGDNDTDNDGVNDAQDSSPNDSHVCRDLDNDSCDDCAVVHTGGGSVSNDGPDSDGDGICDAGEDTDGDGIKDAVDDDIDGDGIPNTAEGAGDTDGDGIKDVADLDSDGDGIADLVEAGGVDANDDGRVDGFVDTNHDGLDDALKSKPLPRPDTDGDGRRDYVDLDSDDDGLSDVLEGGGAKLDADADGHIDDTFDDNDNGWDDSVDGSSTLTKPGMALPLPDTDKDGKADYVDVDSDADSVRDAVEGHDFNADGKADKAKTGDANHDGLDDAYVGQKTLPDRDGDRLPDYRDADDDADGLPSKQEVADAKAHPELGDDPDHDGVPSYLDPDSDGDGVNDTAESTGDGDIDDDGIPDYLQPTVYPDDTDGDGIPDYIERPNGMSVDSDGDGTADYLDTDDDGDGIPTSKERVGGKDVDSDGDGKPDYLDPDDDNDGVPTHKELAADGSNTLDTDGDGIPNQLDTDDDNDGLLTHDEIAADGSFLDTDKDGTPNHLDADDDGDGIPTKDELDQDGKPMDSDKDGIPDHLDTDDDGDGVPTKDELDKNGKPMDSDKDGKPDYLDTDDDGDGIPTSVEHVAPGNPGRKKPISNDIDGDGIPNYLDRDSDGDGIPDKTEATADNDHNGVPDYQEPPTFGYSGGALCSTARVHAGSSASGLFSIFFLLGVLVRRRRGTPRTELS